ncbi:CAP domain-containing protein [Halosimplex carlsbadense]|uniref:CAP domain-containing protein n=1 Tax=Halosimplex carlsbadense TaxID=171164 RepID=UPI001268EE98|nr:CAP domain-containing protein [Halosimplex carlsbadense]
MQTDATDRQPDDSGGSTGTGRSVALGVVAVAVLVVVVGALAAPTLLDSLGQEPAEQAAVDAPNTPTPAPAAAAVTDTATPTDVIEPASTPTATPRPTPTPGPSTPTPEPSTPTDGPIPLNESALEAAVESEINDHRRTRGIEAVQTSGSTVETIRSMARNHTRQLRADGRAWSIPTEYNIVGLYRAHDLYQACAFKGDGEYVIRADDGDLMTVQRVEVTGSDESRLADGIVDAWANSEWHSAKLAYRNAERAGVGVTYDSDKDVAYVAMSMC